MKRKQFLRLLFTLLALTVFIGMIACKGPVDPQEPPASSSVLPSPQNLSIEKRILTWDPIEHANGYVVRIGNDTYETEDCRLALYGIAMNGGTYTVEVMARGNQATYTDSVWAKKEVSLIATPAQGRDDKGFQFVLVEDHSGYEISKGTANLRGELVLPDYYCDLPVKRIAPFGFRVSGQSSSIGGSVSGNNVTTSIVFPAHLESIGERAFFNLWLVEELVIPEGVTEIELAAFQNALILKHLTLPKSLKIVGNFAFESSALEELILPEGLESIGSAAFACQGQRWDKTYVLSDLSSVVIPASVTTIGTSAFEGRVKLTNVQFAGNNIQYLAKDAFAYTPWYDSHADSDVIIFDGPNGVPSGILYEDRRPIPEVFTIPSDIKTIAGNAFTHADLSNVKKVVIPTGVKLATEEIFQSCKALTEVILPEDLEYIPATTFSDCSSLVKINFPASLKIIERGAFSNSGILEAVLPEGVTNLGKYAFSYCTQLKTLVIPASVQMIEEPLLFTDTPNLTVFYGGSAYNWEYLRLDMERRLNEEYQDMPTWAEEKIKVLREILASTPTYFYMETKPTDRGLFWHFVDGVPTPW